MLAGKAKPMIGSSACALVLRGCLRGRGRVTLARSVLFLCLSGAPFLCTTGEQWFDEHTIRASDFPEDAPRFEEYPAVGRFGGEVAPADIRSDPESRMFRTMIRQGAKLGPNFAGHFTIVTRGCGTGCTAVAIVDANTGKVHHPPNLRAVHGDLNIAYRELVEPGDGLIKFRLDSRLLIVIGGINEDPALRGISYFAWNEDALQRIHFVHKAYQ